MSPARNPDRGLRALLAALATVLLAACASPPDGPFSGGDGLGGTGKVAAGDGLGGTGRTGGGDGLGGTGIVGVITGFGSVHINGISVELSRQTALTLNTRPAVIRDLRAGQVAEILAETRSRTLHARSISVHDLVRGPLEAVRGDTLQLLGQTVSIDGRTLVAGGGTLAPGDWVAISGLRRADASVLATRIERVTADGRIHLGGRVDARNGSQFRVGRQWITRAAAARAVSVGETVWVAGRLRGTLLVAEQQRVLPAVPFAGRTARLVMQGFSRPTDDVLQFVDWGMRLAGRFSPAPAAGSAEPILVDARLTATGGYRIERLYFERPETPGLLDPVDYALPPAAPPERPESIAVDRPPAGDRPPALERPVPPERPERPEPVPIQDLPPTDLDRPPDRTRPQ